MNQQQQGFTLLELMAALAIGAMMILGLSVMIDRSLDDTKGQQTALYQAQVATAAGKYISENYAALANQASAKAPARVNVDALKKTGHLSNNFNPTNAYGQTPCVLVLKTSDNRLDALVVTEGGVQIAAKDIAYIAANAGQGGGYFDSAKAKGAFGSWTVSADSTPALNSFLSDKCSLVTAGPGHLATALFYDSDGKLTNDFLYRNAVSGHEELNAMSTPLKLARVDNENGSDGLCGITVPNSNGRIAVNKDGVVLSCQAGIWTRSGAGSWKEPVPKYDALPPGGPTSANVIGDVRMVSTLHLAFMWDGGAWSPLAADQNGNLSITGKLTAGQVLIQTQITAGTSCEQNGLIAVDNTGMAISCQLGIWRKFAESEIIAQKTAPKSAVDFYFHQKSIAGPYDNWLDLSALSGSRPLFISGRNNCKSYDDNTSDAHLEYFDASKSISLGYAGGCVSLSDDYSDFHSNPPNGYPSRLKVRVMAGNYMALQKIPENAKWLHITMNSSGDPENYTALWFNIFNSR